MVTITYINAEWKGKLKLGKEVLEHLKHSGAKSAALFAAVQFLNLEAVKKQLKELGIAVKTAKAVRAHAPMQILGCDIYKDSFETDIIATSDAVLYIGDGMFHPKALVLAQSSGSESAAEGRQKIGKREVTGER